MAKLQVALSIAYELGKSDRSAKFRTMQDVREAR